jgi:hypothetical protein
VPRSTQAKSMHFAALIPDWNSLDSVRRTHSGLEAAALVFFALLVLFDILAHLSIDNKKRTLLEKIGLCCFAIAVFAEVMAYPYGQRNDTLSGKVIGSLDAETGEALNKSGTALAQSREAEIKSGAAIDKAEKAQESLGNAENEANRAQRASSNALILATGARQEADSFEKEVTAAKKDLAVLKSATSARSILDLEPLKKLRPLLKGKRVDILSHAGDEESRQFCMEISNALAVYAYMNPNTGCGALSLGGSSPEVIVGGPNPSEVTALVDALGQATGRPVWTSTQQPPRDELTIFVGSKNPVRIK